jgi:hypothetical protein
MGSVELRGIVFEYLVIGWIYGFGGIQRCDQGIENVTIVQNSRRGERVYVVHLSKRDARNTMGTKETLV